MGRAQKKKKELKPLENSRWNWDEQQIEFIRNTHIQDVAKAMR